MKTLSAKNLIFEKYYLDLSTSKDRLPERLNRDGIITFDQVESKKELLAISQNLGRIFMHRDSDEDGVTNVMNKETNNQKAGYQGLTSSSLNLHTDRSGVLNPPELLVFYCKEQAREGGHSILMDGKRLYNVLKEEYPAILQLLSEPTAVLYGSGDNYFNSGIFNKKSGSGIQLRFRYDDLGFYSSSTISALPILIELINKYSFSFKLEEKQGYIIKNDRWLHGRTGFVGNREMYRILLSVDPDINNEINTGFTP